MDIEIYKTWWWKFRPPQINQRRSGSMYWRRRENNKRLSQVDKGTQTGQLNNLGRIRKDSAENETTLIGMCFASGLCTRGYGIYR